MLRSTQMSKGGQTGILISPSILRVDQGEHVLIRVTSLMKTCRSTLRFSGCFNIISVWRMAIPV